MGTGNFHTGNFWFNRNIRFENLAWIWLRTRKRQALIVTGNSQPEISIDPEIPNRKFLCYRNFRLVSQPAKTAKDLLSLGTDGDRNFPTGNFPSTGISGFSSSCEIRLRTRRLKTLMPVGNLQPEISLDRNFRFVCWCEEDAPAANKGPDIPVQISGSNLNRNFRSGFPAPTATFNATL